MPTDDAKPNLVKRGLRRTATILGTLGTVAIAGLAVAGGAQFLAARADQTPSLPPTEAVPVSVSILEREDGFETTQRYVGLVEAARVADMSFEFGGRVSDILVEEGDQVAAGDVLARLDTELLVAEEERLVAARAALEAQIAFADLSLERRQDLNARGFAPNEALDRATTDRAALAAQIAETDAALRTVEIRVEKSELKAPFAGRIGARMLDPGISVGAGQALLSILEGGQTLVRMGLPLGVDPTSIDRADLTVQGQPHTATLHAVRPDIDATTRTRTVLFTLDGAPQLAFGQTATLEITRRVAASGAWVPVSALREGAQGTWTILVLDDDTRVRTAAVEIIHSEGERVFVQGSFPNGARLVNSGPHRVTPGQQVRVSGES